MKIVFEKRFSHISTPIIFTAKKNLSALSVKRVMLLHVHSKHSTPSVFTYRCNFKDFWIYDCINFLTSNFALPWYWIEVQWTSMWPQPWCLLPSDGKSPKWSWDGETENINRSSRPLWLSWNWHLYCHSWMCEAHNQSSAANDVSY